MKSDAKSSADQLDAHAIGRRLAKLRTEAGMSQGELGKHLGIPQSVISRYERGVVRLHGELIVRVAAILGTTPDHLLGVDKRQDAIVVNPRWRKRIEKINRLPKRDRQALLRTLDALLRQSG